VSTVLNTHSFIHSQMQSIMGIIWLDCRATPRKRQNSFAKGGTR